MIIFYDFGNYLILGNMNKKKCNKVILFSIIILVYGHGIIK